MAIKFVDVASDAAKPAGKTPDASREAAPVARPAPPSPGPESDGPANDAEDRPVLPLAKPEPKPRGRKKPLSAAVKAREPEPPAVPLLDGLILPELQAHAKPVPKPRGRKKAFG